MNDKSNGVVTEARTELTTAAKRTANAISAMAAAANHVVRDTSVARQISPAHPPPSAAWFKRRSPIGPEKSASNSIANEPNAANVARVGLPITLSLSANIAGMISAVRVARRNARYPGSCACSHSVSFAVGGP